MNDQPDANELARIYQQHDQERQAREVQRQAERDAQLRATHLETPSQTKKDLERFIAVATAIKDGLDGTPFSWRGVDAQYNLPVARAMQITLITKSRAAKLGFALKRNAQPVGKMYFSAPISKYADVYVLQCQFNRVPESEEQL
jgi:hypothetical protein